MVLLVVDSYLLETYFLYWIKILKIDSGGGARCDAVAVWPPFRGPPCDGTQIITCQQPKDSPEAPLRPPQRSPSRRLSATNLDNLFTGNYSKQKMIDHVLGRPSHKLKSVQVLLVVLAWTTYLARGNRHGPWILRQFSRRISNRLTAWQTFCVTMTGLYLLKNADKLLGLGGNRLP
jgi:hypothetical protein